MRTGVLSLLVAVPVVAGVSWILASALHIYPDPIEVTSDTASRFKERPLPKGTSWECLALESETRTITEEGRTCQLDEECTYIDHQHCPFGCEVAVNEENLDQVHAALDRYQEEIGYTCGSSCIYRCMRGTYIASCVDNRCQTERLEQTPPGGPPVPEYPFEDETNKSLNTDARDAGAG